MERLIDAIYFAAEKHKDQRRKNEKQTPYINHPLHVMCILSDNGVTDVDVLISAVLHDTVEDTDTSFEELEQKFGSRVASIVRECSDNKSLDKVERKKLQLEHAANASLEAKLVKMADKYSNLTDLHQSPPKTWSKEEIVGYSVWAFEVCKRLYGLSDPLNYGLESNLKKVFEDLGVSQLSDEDRNKLLQTYYQNIQSSE